MMPLFSSENGIVTGIAKHVALTIKMSTELAGKIGLTG